MTLDTGQQIKVDYYYNGWRCVLEIDVINKGIFGKDVEKMLELERLGEEVLRVEFQHYMRLVTRFMANE